jgi:hypothetical protein
MFKNIASKCFETKSLRQIGLRCACEMRFVFYT